MVESVSKGVTCFPQGDAGQVLPEILAAVIGSDKA